MGLFLIHMVEYFELYWHQPEPGPVNTWTFFLFGGKAYAMFALLFGVSFFIIMESQARKGVDFGTRFLWRLAVLFALGFIHGLMYGGDILQILAVTGLILVPLYRVANTTLLAISLFFILQGPSLLLFGYANLLGELSYDRPLHSLLHPAVFETYANGTFLEVLRTNLWDGQLAKWSFMIESGRIWNIIGLSLFGFLLARNDFFTDVERYKSTYAKAFIVALVLAGVCTLWAGEVAALANGAESAWIVGNVMNAYTNHTWIAVSMLGLILLYHFTSAARILRLLAPCGRISLTIYVSQAFILVPFFYGYGAAAYSWIGQPLSLALGIVLWCLQVAFAHYWIKNYHYGPFEWLWRSATWLTTDVPFRRCEADPAKAAVVPG